MGSEITVDVQTPPEQVGFDAARLARIDRHFATYVDDGRLPGWQIVVSRRGQIVHSSTYGMRDVEAGLPVEPDMLFRIYSPLFAETTLDGMGFGLGFSVVDDPVQNKVLASPGEFAWGGMASTAFWVDPAEDVTALFFTQLMPSSTYPICTQLKQLVYQALVA